MVKKAPIKPMDLTERVREYLLNQLSPETRLTENSLALHFKVCRASIREALKALEKEGIIDRNRSLGISLHQFTLKDICEIYDLRAVLEGFACGRACQVITHEQLQELEKIAQEYTRAVEAFVNGGDGNYVGECDVKFHAMLIDIAGNTHLHEILDSFALMRKSFRLYTTNYRRNRGVVNTPYSHDEIVKALRSADAQLCERLMREHVLWAKRHLIEEVASNY